VNDNHEDGDFLECIKNHPTTGMRAVIPALHADGYDMHVYDRRLRLARIWRGLNRMDVAAAGDDANTRGACRRNSLKAFSSTTRRSPPC
jgi:hypothetical protein